MGKSRDRRRFKRELYRASLNIFGDGATPPVQEASETSDNADDLLATGVLDLFPSIIKNKLLGNIIKIDDNTVDTGNLFGICKLLPVNGSQMEDGCYNITVVPPNKRRKFIGIREWKSVYDFAGHGISHLFDLEFDNISNDASFRRVFDKESYFFKGETGISPAEFFAESVWCFLRYNDIFRKYLRHTARWIKHWFNSIAYDLMLLDFKVNGATLPSIQPLMAGNYFHPLYETTNIRVATIGNVDEMNDQYVAPRQYFEYVNTSFYDFLCDVRGRLAIESSKPIIPPATTFLDNLIEAGDNAARLEHLHQQLVNARSDDKIASIQAALSKYVSGYVSHNPPTDVVPQHNKVVDNDWLDRLVDDNDDDTNVPAPKRDIFEYTNDEGHNDTITHPETLCNSPINRVSDLATKIPEVVNLEDNDRIENEENYTVEDIQLGRATLDDTYETSSNVATDETMSSDINEAINQVDNTQSPNPTDGWSVRELVALADEIDNVREQAGELETDGLLDQVTSEPLDFPVAMENETTTEAINTSEDVVKEMTADIIAEAVVEKIDNSNEATQPPDIPQEVKEEARDELTNTVSFTAVFVEEEVEEKLNDKTIDTLDIIMDNIDLVNNDENDE